MKLFDTTLPMGFSKMLFEEKNYDLAAEHTDKIATVLFTAVAGILNGAKEKERPVAFTFDRLDGSIAAACIVRFFENEDPTKPGNWNMVWTFDESDIPEGSKLITIKDPLSHSFFRAIAGEKYGIKFKNPDCLVELFIGLLEQIRKWLDENAAADKEVCVELDSVFQARVAVEGGEKVFALEAAGEIKQLIKDDASIEK